MTGGGEQKVVVVREYSVTGCGGRGGMGNSSDTEKGQ